MSAALASNKEVIGVLKRAFTCIGCKNLLEYEAPYGTAVHHRVVEYGLCWVCRRLKISAEKETDGLWV